MYGANTVIFVKTLHSIPLDSVYDTTATTLKGTRFETLGLDYWAHGTAAVESVMGRGTKAMEALKASVPNVSPQEVEAAVQKGVQGISALVKDLGPLARLGLWFGKAVPYLNGASAAVSTATAVQLHNDPEAWRAEKGLADLSAGLNVAAAGASVVPVLGWAASSSLGLVSMGVDVALVGTLLAHKFGNKHAPEIGGAVKDGSSMSEYLFSSK